MSDRALSGVLKQAADALLAASRSHAPKLTSEEVGVITSVGEGVVWARGLGNIRYEELVVIGGGMDGSRGVKGLALEILPEKLGIVLLDESGTIRAGDEVRRTGQVLSVPVGEGLLGRVVGPLGEPLDTKGVIPPEGHRELMREAPPIIHRAPVKTPLMSGIKAVDALIPVGRGQRELILGDRQTGKTAVALAAIANQQAEGVVCIYCSIGQRASATAKTIQSLKAARAMSHTIVVVAEPDAPPGVLYAAPYAAMSMGEYFMEKGRDVLVVLDDLTRHARAYRELSLLLRRPPGREAFPGDIFYIHSRLLERSTHLREEHGGGSLTALPIIETEAQNVSAYIPTNLISITDGQIYLNPDLFQRGILPAIDVGLSVSRVGGKTQIPAYRAVAGDLKLSYSQFQELENFARFGTRLDESTRAKLEHGKRVREVLKQGQFDLLSAAEQIALLYAVTSGLLDEVAIEKMERAQTRLVERVRGDAGLAETINALEPGSQGWNDLASVIESVLAGV